MNKPLREKNRRSFAFVMVIVLGMIGLTAASVPLYDLFCRVTGYGGTTQRGEITRLPQDVSDQEITIRFSARTADDLDWYFAPEMRHIRVKIGQPVLMHYEATNQESEPVVGTAIYNITPHAAAPYFVKMQCFCFERQALAPDGQTRFPVYFYVHPDILQDRDLNRLPPITLSYTFLRDQDQTLREGELAESNPTPYQEDNVPPPLEENES